MLGALGKRETEDGRGTCALEAAERGIVRRQAAMVVLESVAIAIVLTAMLVLVPV